MCSSVRPSSSRYFTSFDSSSSAAYSEKYATLPSAAFSSIETCEELATCSRVFVSTCARSCGRRLRCMQLLVLSARLPRRNESPESIEIFSLYRCRARKIKPWFTGNPPSPRWVDRSRAIFSSAFRRKKGPKDDNRAKWPFITPERTVVALENPTYILRSCRFAQHAARSTRRPASSPFPTRRSRRRGVLGSNTPPCRSDSVPSVPSPARPRGASFALFRVVNGYRIGTLRCRSTPGFARLGRFPATRERAWAFLVRKRQEPALHRR